MATFGTGGHNIVTVEFTGLHDAPHSFGITVDPDVQGQDLYFYVFANTLVGQDQHGRSKGVTITRIETIRREIQSGADVPAVRLPIPLNMLSNLNLIPSPSKKSGQ